MNPSAADWILKFFNLFERKELTDYFENENEFYKALKSSGFIYGISVGFLPTKKSASLKLTKEELTKINLFHALVYQFFQYNKEASNEAAIASILSFYKELEKGKTGFFHKFSLAQSPSHNLEHILSARLQEGNALLKRNTISLLTYALLFLDVMAYKRWLQSSLKVKEIYKQLEEVVLNYCFFTLKSKRKKSKYDNLMIELFESSRGYILEHPSDSGAEFLKQLKDLKETDAIEKKFILDLCCLTIWEDFKLDESEYEYLLKIIDILGLPERELAESLSDLEVFSEDFNDKIVLFEYANPIKQFYKQSSSTVKLLIIRNKHRLGLELEESGELLMLLGHSTRRELTAKEKAKVKEQLLDICKTIPSLTIFLLPGGTVLLPLLIKFIPRLLPSAFQDNRIE
ncbi:MAG TPA: LETM1-related biofilm-associated protein [Aequorivita sp.]|nr:LETM1-related biofilm-associated protein [Aequorivita sp.]